LDHYSGGYAFKRLMRASAVLYRGSHLRIEINLAGY
jgi:hypothetical protein